MILKGAPFITAPPWWCVNQCAQHDSNRHGLKDGEGYTGIQTNWGQAGTLIASGEPDAIVLPELFPGSRLTSATAAGKMTGWSMPKDIYEGDAMQKYMAAPGSAPFTMDINELRETMGEDWTFISEDDTFRAFATIGGNVVHKDMDDNWCMIWCLPISTRWMI